MPNNNFELPDFGNDWFDGCENQYIILSLKMSNAVATFFWKANALGYTDCLINAGRYNKADILGNLAYYHDGINTVAVPLTRHALALLSLYPIVAEYELINTFLGKQYDDTRDRKL